MLKPVPRSNPPFGIITCDVCGASIKKSLVDGELESHYRLDEAVKSNGARLLCPNK